MNAELFRRLHPIFSAFLTPETAGILLSLGRPALRLVAGGSTAVHLGGRPLLPAGEPWPTTAGRPMDHLGTIDFSGVPPMDGLPTRGHASFYYSGTTPSPWDDRSGPHEGWRVYAHGLKPAAPPVPSPSAPEPQSWGVAPFWSLPSPLDPALDLLERARPGTLGPYGSLYESWLDQVWPEGGPRHQIGGWPVLLELDRSVGPPEPSEVPAILKAPPHPGSVEAPGEGSSMVTGEPRRDQVVRLTGYQRTTDKRKRGHAAPSLRDPLEARFGPGLADYAMSRGLVPLPRRTGGGPGGPPGKPVGQPTACNPSGEVDGDRLAMKPGPAVTDRGRLGRDGDPDPAFLHPRIPRRSVSVLPANVDSLRLEEVRAAVAAARSRPSEGEDVSDEEARRASDARRADTRRLTDRLRELLGGRRLILQLDSDPRLGWFWGDPGHLFFTVQPEAPLESSWLSRHAL